MLAKATPAIATATKVATAKATAKAKPAIATANQKVSNPHDNPTDNPLCNLLGAWSDSSDWDEQEQTLQLLDVVHPFASEKHKGDEAFSPPELTATLAEILRIGLLSEKQVCAVLTLLCRRGHWAHC